MTAKRYEFLTTGCLLAAVASSFLFGKLGSFNWLAVFLGIVAAVVAVSVYFYNVSCERSESEHRSQPAVQEEQPASETIELIDVNANTTRVAMGIQASLWQPLENLELDVVNRSRYYSVPNLAVYFHKDMNNVASLQRKHLLFERSLFLEEVVELVDRLSPTCEFELSSEGKLAILPRRPMASGLEHLDDTRLDDNPAKNSQPN